MPGASQSIACPKCRLVLEPSYFNAPVLQPCHGCQSPLQVETFPALFREESAVPTESMFVAGDASCFYHPEKKAAVVCDACGRFLCPLCDVEFDSQHVCPSCLEIGQKKGKIKKLENRRTRHERIALVLALVTLVVYFFAIVTGPLTVYYAIRHWNSPGSVVPHRPKVTLAIAIIIAVLVMAAWVVFLVYRFAR